MAESIHFFIGKGGVGKSTSSALTALSMAGSGRKTLLVSMDPAHNQCDLFERVFSEKPVKVTDNLLVKEVDTETWSRKYLKETEKSVRSVYSYQSAFNLGHHFKVLRYSPGLEEYALQLAFEDAVNSFPDIECIVFDMAPTALTLRFFSLPDITLAWLDQLSGLRREILNKKEIISKIKFGKKDFECDKISSRLAKMNDKNRALHDLFRSGKCHINLVTNQDDLSSSESRRIKDKLNDIGMEVQRLVVNKCPAGYDKDALRKIIDVQRVDAIPLADRPIVGLSALSSFLEDNMHSLAVD